MGVVYKAEDTRLDRYRRVEIPAGRDFPRKTSAGSFPARSHRWPSAEPSEHLHDSRNQRIRIAGSFIAMELLQGETAEAPYRRPAGWTSSALSSKSACRAAHALDAAHTKSGIIHRDIKPANIFEPSAGRPRCSISALRNTPASKAPIGPPGFHGARPRRDTTEDEDPHLTSPGVGAGNRGVHVPGAGAGQSIDALSGPLQLRRGALRDGDGTPQAFSGAHRPRRISHAILHPKRRHRRIRLNPDMPQELERIHEQGAGEGPQPSLPARIGNARGPEAAATRQRFGACRPQVSLARPARARGGTSLPVRRLSRRREIPRGDEEVPAVTRPKKTSDGYAAGAAALIPLALVAIGGYFYFHRAPQTARADRQGHHRPCRFHKHYWRRGVRWHAASRTLCPVGAITVSEYRLRRANPADPADDGPEAGREAHSRDCAGTLPADEHRAVLEGSIAQIGAQYLLTVKAINCSNGESLASTEAQASDKNHVLDALGKTASDIRNKLGESLSTVQKFDTPLEQATTPSLEALEAFSRGRSLITTGVCRGNPIFQACASNSTRISHSLMPGWAARTGM